METKVTQAKADAIVYAFKGAVRVGFSNIVTAAAYKKDGQEKGDPRFDATFLLDPASPDLVAIKDLCIAELKKANPGKSLIPRRLSADEMANGALEVVVPWKDGTAAANIGKATSKDREFMRGQITLKASSKFAPALSGVENGKIVAYTDPNTRPTLTNFFYSGAWVVPYVQVHTYPAKGSPTDSGYKPGGVSLWLSAVCFLKHDTKLAGAGQVNAAEVFAHYAGSVSTVDPTAGSGSGDAL
jgi:hypothetical protein